MFAVCFRCLVFDCLCFWFVRLLVVLFVLFVLELMLLIMLCFIMFRYGGFYSAYCLFAMLIFF